MTRTDLTDQEYERLAPLLPSLEGKRVGQYRDHRRVLNGILWVLRTGAPWRDLPERFGAWKTCHDRLLRWRRLGVWERVLQVLQSEADQAGEQEWSVVSVDGANVRAHPHAAGARRGPTRKKGELADGCEAPGRSRGGWGSKLHLAVEGRGRPLAVRLTAGQRHEGTQLASLLDRIRVPRQRGRPRKRPGQSTLDRGYSYPKCRQELRRRGIRHVIPERKDQRERRQAKGYRGGRPPRFDRAIYRLRSWAERCVNRLKQFRQVATRYEKRAANYLAFVHFACIMIWLRA